MTEQTIKDKNIFEDITGKRHFTEHSFGSTTDYDEITQGEYEKYLKMSDHELYKFAEEHLISASVKYGYGYYGVILLNLEGVPFLGITSGSSCD